MGAAAKQVETDWMVRGACRGKTTLFFPAGGGYPGAAARAVCESCPVLGQCSAYADAERPEGFWAGRQRHKGRP